MHILQKRLSVHYPTDVPWTLFISTPPLTRGNLGVVVLHPALRLGIKEAAPASGGARRPLALEAAPARPRRVASNSSADAEQDRSQEVAGEAGPGERHQLSADVRIEAIAAPVVAANDDPGTSGRLADERFGARWVLTS